MSVRTSLSCTVASNVRIAILNSSLQPIAESSPDNSSDRTIHLDQSAAGTVDIEWGNWCSDPDKPPLLRLQIPNTGWVTVSFPASQASFVPSCGDPSLGVALGVGDVVQAVITSGPSQ